MEYESGRKKFFTFLRFVLPEGFDVDDKHVVKLLQSQWLGEVDFKDPSKMLAYLSCLFEVFPWKLPQKKD